MSLAFARAIIGRIELVGTRYKYYMHHFRIWLY